MHARFWLVVVMTSTPAVVAAQELAVAGDGGGQAVIVVPGPRAPGAPLEPAPTPAPIAEAPRSDDEEIEGYSGFGLWLEQMNLSGMGVTLGSPEIAALRGLQLGPEWAGNAPLATAPLGGVSLAVGMRAQRFLRGPELRFYFGGGEVNGPWAAAQGAPEGMELAVRSALVFRAELALGAQLPLGPVVPYVLGRAAVGGAWIDLAVRDGRLGELGTETVDATITELGVEAGVELRLDDGVALGVAFRGSFLGTESYGGVMSFGFVSE